MKLSNQQIQMSVDTWIGRMPKKARYKSDSSMPYIKSIESRKQINVGNNSLTFQISKNMYELLNECRKRKIERYIRDSQDNHPINLLGGVRDNVLSTVVSIQHKAGCTYFSPVEPGDFLNPMYELQLNGYIPKVLVRVTVYHVKESCDTRVRQMQKSGCKEGLILLSCGLGGFRAESIHGDMQIQVVKSKG